MDEKKNILIVEDDKKTSKLLEKFIHEIGYNAISSVSTGEEAIKKSKILKPDIVLMDITLEGTMDGIDSAKYIYDNYFIPVIYITHSTEDSIVLRIRETNPFGYIIKPIDKNELKAAIEMAILKFSMERKLIENEERYSTILSSISDAVIVTDKTGKVTYMNPVAEFMTGCKKESVIGENINDAVILEYNKKEYRDLEVQGIGNIRDRVYIVSSGGQKIPVDYRSSPQLDKKGAYIGTVMVYRDISERIKSEDNMHESFKMLRKAMGGVIQAIAHTVEKRDPYTAGHQRKVSNIGRLIGNKMRLPYDKIDGIRMAGVIHDLGKISIPAEILSKPGKITDVEYNLIKSHPQIGFEILKTIEFPWPIAEIVYQHHERLDGSGYPRGLKGDNILIESRIIAVADVVEAMASHRPYRPSLGLELALEEISKFSGLLYDRDAVNSCINIFREDGYTFDDL